MIITFFLSWWLEYKGGWHYTTSIFFFPGGVPLEILGVYTSAVPFWVYLVQRTFESNLDSITSFGAPELLIAIGFIFFLIEKRFFWLSLFWGISGLIVVERKELAVYIGIAAFLVEFIIEGLVMIPTQIIVWDNGKYEIATPLQFMFAAWVVTGYLVKPKRRLVG
jgi:hypothetical protein